MRGDLLLLFSDGLSILCLTRCLLPWAGLDSRHPLLVFCTRATNWLVRPLHKITPAKGRWDWACILAALLLYYIVFSLMAFLALPQGLGGKIIAANMIFALLGVLKSAAYVLFLGLLVRMFASFSAPFSPLAYALQRIFEPLLKPFAFLRIGRYDFSGSVLVLILWFWLGRVLPQLTVSLNLWLLQ
ncbi:YggT family protein [Neisseria perflava]|uniref:YggT family protein n=1 Tax=Neisseria perflava TaxID=33053 RepID=UPI00209D4FBF|nr:YggT family protein [Neisseria perflava]MCP1660990.1 YggT family protein [Neisseria perflava]MCP1772932.1 YggT family protein [Neisseria perflava]